MSDRLNHHFVPRHHLRLFADGRRFLSLVSRDGGLVVPQAGIRGQCARHNYYGDPEIEAELAVLEGRHAVAFKAARDYAWSDGPELEVIRKYQLREGLLLQRNRTPRRAMLAASSVTQFTMHAFKEHLAAQHQTRENRRMLRELNSGRIVLEPPEAFAVRFGIQSAVESVPLTMDLNLHVLRNRTGLPFVLSDSPCVFSNHYKRDITNLGVSGVVSRGLMIAMPLDSRTQVLMLDSAVYHPRLPAVVDVDRSDDVQVLNILQVYEGVDCVYVASVDDVEYVRELVLAHPSVEGDGVGGFGIVDGRDAAGHKLEGELTHIYEPAPPVTMDLTFLETDARPVSENLIEPRSRELLERFDANDRRVSPRASTPIEELVEWVKPRIASRDGT